jgi:hypothetical protein
MVNFDAYTLSHQLMDSWRKIIIGAMGSAASINKQYASTPVCVIIAGGKKYTVSGCHIEGNEIILDTVDYVGDGNATKE